MVWQVLVWFDRFHYGWTGSSMVGQVPVWFDRLQYGWTGSSMVWQTPVWFNWFQYIILICTHQCDALGVWTDPGDFDRKDVVSKSSLWVIVGCQNPSHCPGSTPTFATKFNVRFPQCLYCDICRGRQISGSKWSCSRMPKLKATKGSEDINDKTIKLNISIVGLSQGSDLGT